jgi:hypothetical protein
VAVVGDSVWGNTAGSAAGGYQASVGPYLMHLMGWPDICISCAGGRGVVHGGGGGEANPYNFNLLPDLLRLNSYRPIGAFIYQGSTNDSQLASAQAAIKTQALADIATIRAQWPTLPIFITGLWGGTQNLSAGQILIENTMASVQAQLLTNGDTNVCFVPILTDTIPWVTGTGFQGSTNGSGNSDFDVFTDAAHPNQSGYKMMAIRTADYIRNWLNGAL